MMAMENSVDAPPGSRLFIVCGKNVEAETLQGAFRPFGNVQNVKVIREKGVAYVKYDKASAAALAMENLNGAVLNNGRGPKLKVLLAEAPNTSRGMHPPRPAEQEISSDPDNIPPRSRLFIVVPKQADPQQISDTMSVYDGLEYCKTDLVASKGVVFCKFTKASFALRALEDTSVRGTVGPYKVKCMLAEPKTKRGRGDGSPQDMFSPLTHSAAKLGDYGLSHHLPQEATHMPLDLPMGHALSPAPMGVGDYSSMAGLGGLSGLGGFNHLGDAANLANMQSQLQAQVGALGFNMNLGSLHTNSTTVTPHDSPTLSKQRLFVVVHKAAVAQVTAADWRTFLFACLQSVTQDVLARLFRKYNGMEYCDLKKDPATGRSKGFCFVNFSTPEAASAAIQQLNGVEFPPHSNQRLKVMYAEQLGVRSAAPGSASHHSMHSGHHSHAAAAAHAGGGSMPRSPMGMSIQASTPSPAHTPLSHCINPSPGVASIQETLANMSIPRVASANGADELEAARRMASPISSGTEAEAGSVARELMFNVAA
ncbi:RNA-binding protein 45 [Tetrabaena socialis]|uniref:RNA-binding protein 45 n=1 Tax=Tetrabaena socialis TaxID=47790 RepID=A0A2J8AGZ0_9CHLO|nr:RNA-binding protein 45 [Tetrabaena socialis]|eukprot:PNH11784.1 RNA-binding protein 45 [Tetrabaena socialis]